MMPRWNIVFGGVLHREPGSVCGFMLTALELDIRRGTGMFEIYEGTRHELRKTGEAMLKMRDKLSVIDERIASCLASVMKARNEVELESEGKQLLLKM